MGKILFGKFIDLKHTKRNGYVEDSGMQKKTSNSSTFEEAEFLGGDGIMRLPEAWEKLSQRLDVGRCREVWREYPKGSILVGVKAFAKVATDTGQKIQCRCHWTHGDEAE